MAPGRLPSGQWSGAPFVPSADWFEKWITHDPNWVYTDETYQQYFQGFGKSGQMFDDALAANSGIRSTESFFRYFLAPGVMHCGTPGPGSIAPANPMQQVVNWVENGQAADVLNASGSINGQFVTRPLCGYPDPDAIYTGGDSTVASSYTCSSRPQFTHPFLLHGQHA